MVKGADYVTELQKTDIITLRSRGLKYKEISDKTGVNISTVISYCRRNATKLDSNRNFCGFCGKEYDVDNYHRRKGFCSDGCYYKWWLKQNDGRKRTNYKKKCANCGKAFTSLSKHQKFCSADCYHRSRQRGFSYEL